MKTPELWLDSLDMVKSGTQNIVQAVQLVMVKHKSRSKGTQYENTGIVNLTLKKIFLDRTPLKLVLAGKVSTLSCDTNVTVGRIKVTFLVYLSCVSLLLFHDMC